MGYPLNNAKTLLALIARRDYASWLRSYFLLKSYHLALLSRVLSRPLRPERPAEF